jgi:hypothetical protein
MSNSSTDSVYLTSVGHNPKVYIVAKFVVDDLCVTEWPESQLTSR